jgi:site-specific DNA-methyltransferase (adenine-specific)
MRLPDPYYDHGGITIYHGDSVALLPAISDASVSMVAMDPPYCGAVTDDWDNQWPTEAAFLDWLDGILVQVRRVLSAAGSLYVCMSPRMYSRVDVMVRERFEVLASIVWDKAEGRQGGEGSGIDVAALRTYWPSNTERILFAEQRSNEIYESVDAALRGEIFEPIRAYLDGERERSGFSRAEVNRLLQTKMATHWFSSGQWKFPTRENYTRMQVEFNARGEEACLQREYEDLRREHEDLRREYERRRRPFYLTRQDQWGEVWRFKPDRERLHPTQKPLAFMSQIVRVSSRAGDLVLDPFMGSGTALVAAKALGRRAIGIEREERYCAAAVRRLSQEVLPL